MERKIIKIVSHDDPSHMSERLSGGRGFRTKAELYMFDYLWKITEDQRATMTRIHSTASIDDLYQTITRVWYGPIFGNFRDMKLLAETVEYSTFRDRPPDELTSELRSLARKIEKRSAQCGVSDYITDQLISPVRNPGDDIPKEIRLTKIPASHARLPSPKRRKIDDDARV